MKNIKDIAKGSSYSDYVVVKNYKNKTLVLPYYVPKGYTQGQALYGTTLSNIKTDEVNAKLSWGHVTYMANAQMLKGSIASNPATLQKDDAFTKMISSFFNGIISGITTFLGLYSVESLFYNAGERGANYYYGMMPIGWLNAINVVNILGTVLALIVIGIAIVKMLIQRNMAAITPSMKMDMMSNIRDLFVVMVGIALFMPMLYILLNFSDVLITAIRNFSPAGASLGLADGAGAFGITSIIINLAFVGVLIALNITFLIRAVTLSILIGFAPFFVALFAAGPAAKKISTLWFKELISNIFLQVFMALVLLIFSNISAYSTLNTLERFALLISFIPLTKFFKGSLMNLGSGSDAVAEKTGGSLGTMAGAFVAGSLLSRFDGKSEKNGKMVDSGKAADASMVNPNVVSSVNTPTSSLASNKEKLKGGFSNALDKVKTIAGNASKPSEIGRLVGKSAVMGLGVAASLGSAASGGNPLLGNSALVGAGNSIFNQAEGWSIPDSVPEDVNVSQGHELTADGISGFNNDTLMFSPEARKNINESPEAQSQFVSSVEAYNQKSENIGKEISLKRQDSNGAIFGAVIPEVKGKTTFMKDEKGKVISSESSFTGKGKLDNFKPLLNDYKNKKVQPNTTGEVNEEGIT